ncbi:hypothetical protein PHLCEN_2v3338 [Hermanssonia centrifuga]|uniref:Pheromone receptor n=1 Tax=Hermanssonia centrifuga TaxID=98765 RepID=A0A2R6QMA6_9APHY|nr:hypothetical protein PHLCEN_2v3338 [Hermanssonia centrifuga]
MASLIEFVDSIVWHGNIGNPAPVWCDITTKFLIGAGVGIPAASLCINRRLYKIASVHVTSITRQAKRRAIFIDISIGMGIPIIVMTLHTIVQGHRFNVLEDIGCIPTTYLTPPAYPLVLMWPLLLGCISFIYATLTLVSFWRRRVEFAVVLKSNSSLTASRYFRLMLLSCIEMVCTVPLGAYSIYIDTAGVHVDAWISWADTHFDFWFIEFVPASVWQNNHNYVVAVELGRWLYPISGLLFFALFGFAEEAMRHYRVAFWWIARHFGIQPRVGNLSSVNIYNKSQHLNPNISIPTSQSPKGVKD